METTTLDELNLEKIGIINSKKLKSVITNYTQPNILLHPMKIELTANIFHQNQFQIPPAGPCIHPEKSFFHDAPLGF